MPQPGPQSFAIQKHLITELFIGGAVGGGKSDFLLGDFAQDIPQEWGKYCRGILFRRTYGELEDLIARSHEIYPPWFGLNATKAWSASDKTWTWPNGATLKMRYLEHSTDWQRYWGHAYTWIGWDELPSWPDLNAYFKMMARLRSAHPVPNKRIRSTGNPGGPGHGAVKAYFGIDRFPNGGVVIEDKESKTTRIFVKSKVQDNKIMLGNDPGYIDRLKGLGSDALVQAWLEGDWNVVAGAFFDCWDVAKHVIRPFEVPAHWTRFGSFDWGSAKPFSYGLWAVSDGTPLRDGRIYPAGALIRYREWYGNVKPDAETNKSYNPNTGLKLTAEQIATGIHHIEAGEKMNYRVADPACFSQDGGPSKAETMAKAGIIFQPADHARIAGWDQVRDRLNGDGEAPMMYVFSTCIDFIRTFPALQHDEQKPEDVDTQGEDHIGDEVRYACMSRPFMKTNPAPQEMRGLQQMTMNELWKHGRARDRAANSRI